MSVFSRIGAYRQHVRHGGSLPPTKLKEEINRGEGFSFPFLGEHDQPVPSQWSVSTRVAMSARVFSGVPQWIKDAPPGV